MHSVEQGGVGVASSRTDSDLDLRAQRSAARAESTLIITDALRDKRFVLGNYIVHRAIGEYDEPLAARGFRRVELQPYAFGSNPNQFAVYRRAA